MASEQASPAGDGGASRLAAEPAATHPGTASGGSGGPAIAHPSPTPGPSDSYLSSLFGGNPYFSAGFGLMALGAVLAGARQGIRAGAAQTQRRLLVTLEIPSRDRAHPWFLQWMGAQAKAQAMRNAGLLPNRKETLREFLGLTTEGSVPSTFDKPDQESSLGSDGASDPLQSAHGRASPIRIYSHELSVETTQSESKRTAAQHLPPTSQDSSDSASREARFAFVPGPGTHFFRYKGCWMRVRCEA